MKKYLFFLFVTILFISCDNRRKDKISDDRGRAVNHDLLMLIPPFGGQEMLKNLGIAGDSGFALVNKFMQVADSPQIYAVGDCTALTGPKLAHMAVRQAAVAAKNTVFPITCAVPAFRPPDWAENTRRFPAEIAVTGSENVTRTDELVRLALRLLGPGKVLVTTNCTAKAAVALPPEVVTTTFPVAVAPAGTANVKLVPLLPTTVAGRPFTTTVAPARFVPVTVTRVPAAPLLGLRLVTRGGGG